MQVDFAVVRVHCLFVVGRRWGGRARRVGAPEVGLMATVYLCKEIVLAVGRGMAIVDVVMGVQSSC